jgi:hypothetical protein
MGALQVVTLLSDTKARPRLRSTLRSEAEGALRRLPPGVPMVETARAGQGDDPGAGGGRGLGWAAVG